MRWGVLEKFDESESEEESDSDEGSDEDGNGDLSGIMSNASSVLSSVVMRKDTVLNNQITNGIVTPNSTISAQEINQNNQSLYRVLQPADHRVRGKFGSSQVYKMPSNDSSNQPPA